MAIRELVRVLRFVAAGSIALITGVASAEAADWGTLTSTVALTSNYIFRGVTQTNNRPAWQASLEYQAPVGVYLGVWGSQIRFLDTPKSPMELDYYGGYRTSVGKWALDVGLTYYAYPHASTSTERFTEYYAKVSRPVTGTLSWNAQFAYSPNFFLHTGRGYYVQTGVLNQFTPWLTGDVNVGEQWAKTLDSTDGAGYPYTNWNAGLTATYKMLSLDARYIGSSLSESECLASAGNSDWCKKAFVATGTFKFTF